MRLQALLSYWRNSLADSEHLSPEIGRSSPFRVEFHEISEGWLPARVTTEVFKEVEKTLSKSKRRSHRPEDDAEIRQVGVLIAPFHLRVVVEHGHRHHSQSRGEKVHVPLWLSGKLDRSGALSGDPELPPWIGRQYLEPSGRSYVAVGDLADSDAFRTTRPGPDEATDWTSHLDYARDLMEAITGQSELESPEFSGALVGGPLMLLKSQQIKAAEDILELYDVLRDSPESCSRLLNAFLGKPDRRRDEGLASLPETGPERHLGHVSSSFGLQPSQRRAVHAALSLKEGEALAVNGPPGTGKTTLIQSLVASLWVERALEGGEPPLIHACTSNNRAIVNILETFARAGTNEFADVGFGTRWFEGIESYGLLMPSKNQAKKHSGRFPMALKGYPEWEHLPKEVQQKSFVENAKKQFLETARRVLGDDKPGLASVISALQDLLRDSQSRLRQTLGLGREVLAARRRVGAKTRTEFIDYLEASLEQCSERIQRAQDLGAETEEAIGAVSIWEDLFCFLPPIRARRDDKVLRPIRMRKVEFNRKLSLSGFRSEVREFLSDRLQSEVDAKVDLEGLAQNEAELGCQVEQILGYSMEETERTRLRDQALESIPELESLLDWTVRRRLFLLAGRYWEGRWLQETEALLEKGMGFTKRQDIKGCRQRFQRFAKLTPVSVSTLFVLPRLFKFWDREANQARPIEGLLDLLIVDEAGQTTPEVGVPALHCARRAVVVGDCQQIEPIWGIDKVLDVANQRRNNLSLGEEEATHSLQSSCGSLMAMAQRVSAWSDGENSPGLLLTEHWRCRPSIADYFSHLAYEGRLDAKRSEKSAPLLPTLGWAHVDYPAENRGGSRLNLGQARAIAAWIGERAGFMEENFGKLPDSLGVVTPFRAQAQAIRQELRRRSLPDLEVGTVHTFQGGEKDVMIFSPVYDASHQGSFFFDLGPNMLNVAVSRARESFLVFGDMGIFDPTAQSPSGLLATRLFAQPGNEITDVLSAPALDPGVDVEALETLEDHRRALVRALEAAKRRVLIVSPYVTENAIREDQVTDHIRAAKERGVDVVIAYCRDLCRDGKWLRDWVLDLRTAGAEIWALDRVHSKVLAVDSEWVAIGSFNWLSAVRNQDSRYFRLETSVVCYPPRSVPLISSLWEKLEARRKIS